MKLHILSDLHLEIEDFTPARTDADLVILAGDIHAKTNGIDWIKTHFPTTPVLYVLGNHEFYGTAFPTLLDKIKEETKETHITILENESIEIGDIAFFGCTLWTDFEVMGNKVISCFDAQRFLPDYHHIRLSPSYRRLRPEDTIAWHHASKQVLNQWSRQPLGRKRVVITHHAPATGSLARRYRQDMLSAAFVSAMDEWIAASGLTLWVHGHTHDVFDYRLGSTRVLCNPRGYPAEGVAFNPELIVEL